jgi:hypothetical protein
MDRDAGLYGINGQPRGSYSGLAWTRYITPFLDGSKTGTNVWSQQPSHSDAEYQLGKFYGMLEYVDGLEPLEVFRKYFESETWIR